MIRINYRIKEGELKVYLQDEIDQHSAAGIRDFIDTLLDKHEMISKLVFDLSKVTFMDSSGIGVILGRYKLMKHRRGRIDIENPTASVKKVLKIAGIYSLVENSRVS